MSQKISKIERDGTIKNYTISEEHAKKIDLLLQDVPKIENTLKPTKNKRLRSRQCKNLAFLTLLNADITAIPVDLTKIAQANNWTLFGYTKNADAVELLDIDNNRNEIDGFSTKYKGQHMICYNDAVIAQRQRWTIAHEIGHIILKHQLIPVKNYEREAHTFAQNLLCPLVAMEMCRIHTPQETAEFFDVSAEAAEIAFKEHHYSQLDELQEENPFEQKFAKQIRPFAENYKATHEEKTFIDFLESPTVTELWINKAMKNKLTAEEIYKISCDTLKIDLPHFENKTIQLDGVIEIFKTTRQKWQDDQPDFPQDREERELDTIAYATAMLQHYFSQTPFFGGVPREKILQIHERAQTLKKQLFNN